MRTLLTRVLPATAVIIAAGIAGFVAHGRLMRPEMMPVAASLAAPPTPGTRGNGSAAPTQPIPDVLPDIAFRDRLGVIRHLSDWKGRPLLVNFWAPWCGPCREEIPFLERLSVRRAPGGLQVLGIAVDSRAAVLDYARRASISYPLLIGEQPGLQAVRALGMEAVFPFSVFVDAGGRIVTLKIGRLLPDEADLILDSMNDLDRGRIDLATARRRISDGMARLATARTQASPDARL
jgi:thiol-disulfide isomerase/thioredoxin